MIGKEANKIKTRIWIKTKGKAPIYMDFVDIESGATPLR